MKRKNLEKSGIPNLINIWFSVLEHAYKVKISHSLEKTPHGWKCSYEIHPDNVTLKELRRENSKV